LGLSPPSVRKMIDAKVLPASQVVECAPWQIPVDALESEVVRREAAKIKQRERAPRSRASDAQQPIFSVN
jgi:hypothetical protein